MPPSERSALIDILRGLAALAVVLYHYVGYIPLLGIPVGAAGGFVVALSRHGYLGVPVFFVLSGYVIAMTGARYTFTQRIAARFVLRRMVRIAPPYWVMIGLFSSSMLAAKALGYLRNTSLTAGQVLAHFFYAQNVLQYPSLDVAYWTLCLEVQFYVVFAVTGVLVARLSPLGQMFCFTALAFGSMLVELNDAAPRAWFPGLWYHFGGGVLAFFAGRGTSSRRLFFLFLLALTAFAVYRRSEADFTVALVAGVLFLTRQPSRFAGLHSAILLGLGRISYSLYLVHGFVGLGLGLVFRSRYVQTEETAWLAVAAGVTGALCFTVIFSRVCETRAIDWSRGIQIDPPRRPVLAA